MLPWVYSLFHMMHLPAACDLQIPISVAPHGSLVCFHVFYHAFFYKIKLHVIPQVASCFFSERLEAGVVLLCRISKIPQKIYFLVLVLCMTELMICKGHFVFTVISTRVDSPNPFFSNHMALAASVCCNESKAGRADWIWSWQMSSFWFATLWPRLRFKNIPKLVVS